MTLPSEVFDDILDELMMSEPEPSYEALLRWSNRYPQFRVPLMDFFAEWGVQAELSSETKVDKVRLSNLGVSYALDLLHRRSCAKGQGAEAGKVSRLGALAQSADFSWDTLAKATQLDAALLRKLDLRRIPKLPFALFERIANVLQVTAADIQAMVVGSPLMAAGIQHKSLKKPTAVTESFSDAIRNSSMSEADKTFWLKIAETEGAQEH
jgi:hypothetical protein